MAQQDRATGKEIGLVELYKKTHFSEKKVAWVHADAEIRHYKLEKRQDKAIEDGSDLLSDEQLFIEGMVENKVQHYLENVPVPNSRGIRRLLQGRLKSNEESMRSWWKEFKSWNLIARNTMPKWTS
ncbi:hypothetical protein ACSBR2_040247 [Camellia fascicularis]